MLKLQCEWGCSVTSCHSDITDLEILVGGGRGEGWFRNTQYLIVVQMKEEKSIFYILRIYSYLMLKVHTSEIVLTYNQKINFGIIYSYQHHNYQKLFNYEAFTLSCDLKTAIKTWPVTKEQVPCLPSNQEYFAKTIQKVKDYSV